MRQLLATAFAVIVVVVASAQMEALPKMAERLPPYAHYTFLDVAAWQWAGLAALVLVCSITGIVISALFNRVTFLRDHFAPHNMGEATRRSVTRWSGLLAGSLLANVLLPDFDLTINHPKFYYHLHTFFTVVTVASAVLVLYGWWDAVCATIASRAEGHRRAERLLVPMLRKFVRVVIIMAGGLLVISLLFGPQSVTGMIAGLGVTGVVLALAAKDSVENVFGSITILFDMPFAIGDWVKIDKVEGAVEEINLRSTRIRTSEDSLINLPNANLIRASVENYGSRRFRREKVQLRIAYKSEPNEIDVFCQALRDYLNASPNIVEGKTIVELDDPQENSVGVSSMWFLYTSSLAEEAHARHQFVVKAIELSHQHAVFFASPYA